MKKFNVLAMTSVVLSLEAQDEKAAAHGVLLEIARGAIQDPSKMNWYIRHVTDKEIDLGDTEFSESQTEAGSVDVVGFEKETVERDWKDVLSALGGEVSVDGVGTIVRLPDGQGMDGAAFFGVDLFRAIVRAACAAPIPLPTVVIDQKTAS